MAARAADSSRGEPAERLGALAADSFAAGAVVVHDGRLVLTLTEKDVPAELTARALRVAWVGGTREPRETPWQCVLREAREEVGIALEQLTPPATYAWDWRTRVLAEREAADGELLRVDGTDGRMAVVYLAAPSGGESPVPGDVPGVLLLPQPAWPLVERGASVAEAVDAGAEVIGCQRLPAEARLWLHPTAALRVAVPLLAR